MMMPGLIVLIRAPRLPQRTASAITRREVPGLASWLAPSRGRAAPMRRRERRRDDSGASVGCQRPGEEVAEEPPLEADGHAGIDRADVEHRGVGTELWQQP